MKKLGFYKATEFDMNIIFLSDEQTEWYDTNFLKPDMYSHDVLFFLTKRKYMFSFIFVSGSCV